MEGLVRVVVTKYRLVQAVVDSITVACLVAVHHGYHGDQALIDSHSEQGKEDLQFEDCVEPIGA